MCFVEVTKRRKIVERKISIKHVRTITLDNETLEVIEKLKRALECKDETVLFQRLIQIAETLVLYEGREVKLALRYHDPVSGLTKIEHTTLKKIIGLG